MNYKIEKVQLDTKQVRKLLQSDDIMKALVSNAPIIGDIDGQFVGFDRCHVIVKDENNAYRTDDS